MAAAATSPAAAAANAAAPAASQEGQLRAPRGRGAEELDDLTIDLGSSRLSTPAKRSEESRVIDDMDADGESSEGSEAREDALPSEEVAGSKQRSISPSGLSVNSGIRRARVAPETWRPSRPSSAEPRSFLGFRSSVPSPLKMTAAGLEEPPLPPLPSNLSAKRRQGEVGGDLKKRPLEEAPVSTPPGNEKSVAEMFGNGAIGYAIAEVVDFFDDFIDPGQFDLTPDWLDALVAGDGAQGPHVLLPLRLWKTAVAALTHETSLAAGKAEAPPSVKFVKVPLSRQMDGGIEDVVERIFKPDANARVSLQNLADAPAYLAAIVHAVFVAPLSPTGAVRVRMPGSLATEPRFHLACGKEGKESVWQELADLLDRAGDGELHIAAEDLVDLVPTDKDGKVSLAELVIGLKIEDKSNSDSPSQVAAWKKAFQLLPKPQHPALSQPATPSSAQGKTGRMMGGKNPPRFIFIQTLVVLVLWFAFALADDEATSWFSARAGLESIFPGLTGLAVHRDCEDLRFQVWRWFTYQYSHLGVRHVTVNCLMNLLLGVQLEEFHGTLRMMVMYNIGVFGGAMCSLVNDVHSEVVGMSGGCYALFGMHLGDLVLNWRQRRFKWAKVALLLILALYDVLTAVMTNGKASVSHSAHFGGYVAGLFISIIIGRNAVVKRWERLLSGLTLAVAFALVVFCLVWGLQWAPRSLWESESWCWSRQVSNFDLFGDDDWHCVRCDSQSCINKWSAEQYISPVSMWSCEQRGGWAVSER
eukprot:TRINITY_DN5345_c0_g1_i2.p1 TRINITY_DN5345_c0_g1~~TRINITY_DN5345_c0_g1_i2.p1  ORF type:complete len:756 (+),score=178.16 TRINITY_DN5345_c0_g1_i2:119-2386(+)